MRGTTPAQHTTPKTGCLLVSAVGPATLGGTNGSNKTAVMPTPELVVCTLSLLVVAVAVAVTVFAVILPTVEMLAVAGFSRGTINSVSAGATVSLPLAAPVGARFSQGTGPGGSAFDGTGGEQAQGGGHGGSSIINGVQGLTDFVLGGRGSPSNDTTIGTASSIYRLALVNLPACLTTIQTTLPETVAQVYVRAASRCLRLTAVQIPRNRTDHSFWWRPSSQGSVADILERTTHQRDYWSKRGAPGIAVFGKTHIWVIRFQVISHKARQFLRTLSPGGQYSGL